MKWRYLRSGYGSKNADFDIVNESGGRVASTPYEDKAALIAAAPELLRELKAAVFYIGTYGGEVTTSFAAGGNLDHVRSLIARAEGEQ